MEQIEPLLEVMRPIAKAHDVPLSAVALNWVIRKGAIPLGGARNKEQAEQVSLGRVPQAIVGKDY